MTAAHLRRLTPLLLLLPLPALAQALPALTSGPAPGGGTQYSLPVQTLLLLTALSFLPAMLLMMTSFTRIIIVLSMLRQAMGTQTSPPNQVLVGLALFLSFFIMAPVGEKIYTDAYLPLTEAHSPLFGRVIVSSGFAVSGGILAIDERAGREHASLGVLPPHECLERDRPPRHDVDDGLEVQDELVSRECGREILLDGALLFGFLMDQHEPRAIFMIVAGFILLALVTAITRTKPQSTPDGFADTARR